MKITNEIKGGSAPTETVSHRCSGFHALLDTPWVYNLWRKLMVAPDHYENYLKFIQPFAGAKILDIGCGPGEFVGFLPQDIGLYVGYDMNPDYIAKAKRKWASRGSFRCERVSEANLEAAESFDIVLATGIIHHLDDQEAGKLFALAYQALKPRGVLVTYDPVNRINNQHFVAKLLIALDRGKAVRSQTEYEKLAAQRFSNITSTVVHNMLRLPYTVNIMRCIKQ